MKRLTTTLAIATMLASFTHAVNLGAANSFNAFIFGNAYTTNGDSEGAIAIGGNWTASGFTTSANNNVAYGAYATIGSDSKVSAYINGNAITSSTHVNQSGNAYVGGNIGSVDMNGTTDSYGHLIAPAGTLYYGGSITGNVNGSRQNTNLLDSSLFTTAESYLKTLSSQLAALPGTAITSGVSNSVLNTVDNNNWYITLSSGLNVFTVDSSVLETLRTLKFTNLSDTTTVVINVTGTTISSTALDIQNGYDKVLWNFSEATTLTVKDRDLNGSVLAPLATVNQYSRVQGTLVAQEWNCYGVEVHSRPFTGDLGELGQPAVPGPAAALSFGSALVASLLRRRKKA